MDLAAASNRLDQIELRFPLGGAAVQVLWFRQMVQTGHWQIGRHSHSSFEFHFVAQGTCRVTLDDGGFAARAGELYLTAPRVFHEQSSFGEAGYTEYSICVDFPAFPRAPESGAATEAAALCRVFLQAGCSPVPAADGIRCFHEALCEAYGQPLGFYSRIQGLAAELLVGAARALEDAAPERPGRIAAPRYDVPLKPAGNDRRFAEIRRFVNENIGSRLHENDICNHVYLSGRQIGRIVRQYTGKTTRGYISSVRLDRAKQLLRESTESLGGIAAELGFSNEYYFNRFFKREEGYPPGVYRKNVRKG